MSTINQIPDSIFYDPDSWIDLAPDIDWGTLIPAPEPEPEEPTVPEEPTPGE